jgi:hypothetical protein
MLIKREVFEKLEAHPAVKPFANDIGLDNSLDNPYMKTYFDTAVRENRYYSEDWTFCENWRDLGGTSLGRQTYLYCKPRGYIHTFDFGAQDNMYQDLHALVHPKVAGAHEAIKQEIPAGEPEVLASSESVDAPISADTQQQPATLEEVSSSK